MMTQKIFNRAMLSASTATVALGLALVIWFVRRSRRSKPALVMDARLARYNDEIEQEMQNLDR